MAAEQKTDSKLRVWRDGVDFVGIRSNHSADFLLGVPTGIFALAYAEKFLQPQGAAAAIAVTWGGLAIARPLLRFFDSFVKEGREHHSWHDDELGYRVDQSVYRGKNNLRAGAVELKKGDNFLVIHMPSIDRDRVKVLDNSPEAQSLWADLNDYVIREVNEQAQGREFKAVAFNVPYFSDDTHKVLRRFPRAKTGTLYQNKDVRLKRSEVQLPTLTREELAAIATRPKDLFLRGLEELGDPILLEYFNLAKDAPTSEIKKQALRLFQDRVINILDSEAYAHFSGAEFSIVRDGGYRPLRERDYHLASVWIDPKNPDPNRVFQLADQSNTGTHFEELEKKIQRYEDIADLDAHYNSSLFRAEVAYTIIKILQEIPFDELVKERIVDKEELLKKLAELGLEVSPASKIVDIEAKKTFQDRANDYSKRVMVPLSALICFMAGLPAGVAFDLFGKTLSDHLPGSSSSSGISVGRYRGPIGAPENFRHDFPNFAPSSPEGTQRASSPPVLNWRVSTFGDISPSGYYAESTSYFVDASGTWFTNHILDDPKQWPQNLAEDTPHISLTKRVALDANKAVSLRIPIKDGTSLGALDLKGPRNSKVDYKGFLMEDGTVEIEMTTNLVTGSPWVDIEAMLVPGQSQIKSTHQISSLDLNRIDQAVKEPIVKIKERDSLDNTFEEALTQRIRETFLYSLDPLGRELLSQAAIIEDRVNAAASIGQCTCEICTEHLVLLSTINLKSQLNPAKGYLHEVDNPASGHGDYLLAVARHEWAVDENGVVFDPTPAILAGDPNTIGYIESVRNIIGNGDTLWKQQQDRLTEEAERPFNGLRLSVIFLAGMGYLYVANKVVDRLGIAVASGKVDRMVDRLKVGPFDPYDLEKAYQFFMATSWGGYEHTKWGQRLGLLDTNALLEKIRENTHDYRIRYYLRHPQEFERLHPQLDIWDKLNFRFIARHLLKK